jgi:nicotinate-nucleotide adenylyltransferase
MKIGLYFGSFNPVHHGHLIIASYLQQNTDLDQVWMVVSPQNPFKENHTLLNEYQRLALVRLAVEGEINIKAIDIEFRLPKPSYTIDTLTYLDEKYPQHEFAVIMGSDGLQNLDKWKSSVVLIKRYPIYVYERPGFQIDTKLNINKLIVSKAPMLEISASLLRRMIQEGKSIRYLVPDSVKEEIEANGYYKISTK